MKLLNCHHANASPDNTTKEETEEKSDVKPARNPYDWLKRLVTRSN